MSNRGEATRLKILEAAERVFGSKGYWGATTEDVARLAGITQPAVYRYFDSKRALFLAAVGLRQLEMTEALREALAANEPRVERMRRYLRAAIDLAEKYPDMARLRLQAAAVAATDDELRPIVKQTLDLLLASHTGLLREAVETGEIPASIDPEQVATLITASGFLLYLGLSLDHPGAWPSRSGAVADHLLDVLLRRSDLGSEGPDGSET